MSKGTPRCPKGTIVLTHDRTVLPTPNWCGTWKCKRCGPRKARRLRLRLSRTNPTRLITLTLRPDPALTDVQLLDVANHAWSVLWRRYRRQFGSRAIGYAKVVELTKRGTPHLHIIATMPYVHKSRLSQAWRELTGSYIVDIRKVNSPRGLSKYLTSYLTKAMEVPEGRRKWSAAANYVPPAEPRALEPGEIPPSATWVGPRLIYVTAAYLAAGYIIADGWLMPPDVALQLQVGPPGCPI